LHLTDPVYGEKLRQHVRGCSVRIHKTRAYARAGLIGNPSDGYYGRTISLIVRNFAASVVIYEWPQLEIIPTRQDHCRFDSLDEFHP
jgi:glucuronokinase